MSKYTGKCDLYDSLISIFNMDENSDWSKVIWQTIVKLNFKFCINKNVIMNYIH